MGVCGSDSITSVRIPFRAAYAASALLTLVRPTPPFPSTAITRWRSSESSAFSALSLTLTREGSANHDASQETAVLPLVRNVEAERDDLLIDVVLVGLANFGVTNALESPVDELRCIRRIGTAEHVERSRIPLRQKMLQENPSLLFTAYRAEEVVTHFGMAELVALDRARDLAQRYIARLAPVTRMERAVQIDQEVKKRIVGPRLLGHVERVMRVWHILQREVAVKSHGEAMEHDRVLQFLGKIFGFDHLSVGIGRERLRRLETRAHQAKKTFIAGALALMPQHLHEQITVFIGQLAALVERIVGAADLTTQVGQRIALFVDARPEWPQPRAALTFDLLGAAVLVDFSFVG